MAEEMQVPLKYTRGSITDARVLYEEKDEGGFRAWIYMGKGQATYAEMQTAEKGERDINTFFEYGDIQGDQDVGPLYKCEGNITHRTPIKTLEDWKAWLIEYAAGLDPLDAFRNYKEAVGGF